MNRENRTSSRRERDSSEREQRNEVGKVRTDMRGSGMTDRRWPVGWSLVVSSHSRHSVLSSLRPSFTHSIPSLRPYRGNRVTAGSEEPRKGRRTTDILHHIWSVSRLPPLRCAKRMSERMSVHLRPLMSYPFRVPRSRLRRFLVSLHSIAPRSGRDRSRSASRSLRGEEHREEP